VIDGKVLYSNNDRLDANNILKFYWWMINIKITKKK
jgi:hypothetical protein